jgi:hypothetical protein
VNFAVQLASNSIRVIAEIHFVVPRTGTTGAASRNASNKSANWISSALPPLPAPGNGTPTPDGPLIQAMLSSEVDYEMVRFTNDISHRMGRKTTAEYVTDSALAEHLGRIGADFAQGYSIGEPRPLATAP